MANGDEGICNIDASEKIEEQCNSIGILDNLEGIMANFF
jgi:hypothetical protein